MRSVHWIVHPQARDGTFELGELKVSLINGWLRKGRSMRKLREPRRESHPDTDEGAMSFSPGAQEACSNSRSSGLGAPADVCSWQT